MTLTNTINSFVIKDEHIKINNDNKMDNSNDLSDSTKNIKEKKSSHMFFENH